MHNSSSRSSSSETRNEGMPAMAPRRLHVQHTACLYTFYRPGYKQYTHIARRRLVSFVYILFWGFFTSQTRFLIGQTRRKRYNRYQLMNECVAFFLCGCHSIHTQLQICNKRSGILYKPLLVFASSFYRVCMRPNSLKRRI